MLNYVYNRAFLVSIADDGQDFVFYTRLDHVHVARFHWDGIMETATVEVRTERVLPHVGDALLSLPLGQQSIIRRVVGIYSRNFTANSVAKDHSLWLRKQGDYSEGSIYLRM
jgi:phage baseplate assembly protein gpV